MRRICPSNTSTRPLANTTRDLDVTKLEKPPAYDSVVTLAFGFVTFTPNCFAFATISTRFREDTACAILDTMLAGGFAADLDAFILSGEGLVVHEEEVDIVAVVDEESLVPGWHQVTGFLIRAVPDLVADIPLAHSSSIHPLLRTQVPRCAPVLLGASDLCTQRPNPIQTNLQDMGSSPTA